MIRAALILGVLLVVQCGMHPSHAQPVNGFDAQIATSVYTAALSFMAPRIVDPEPVSRLAQWGLQGITALDPAMTIGQRDGKLRLMSRDNAVFEIAAPKDEAIANWVPAAVALTKAAADASPAVRRAGTVRIVQAFFDELFNHIDPYSRYIPPSEAGEDREQRSGRAGIGISLAQRGAAVVVTEVIRDGPAATAGVRPGDTIVAIEREAVRGLGATAVMSMIEGPEDTGFTLTWRGRDGKQRESAFTRVLVPPETVFGARAGDAMIVRVAAFNNTTDTHLAHALQDALAGDHPPKGIVLDLRGNRGGLLRQAVTVADTFLPEGVVVSTSGRAVDAGHVWASTPGELAEGVPLIVLVDGRTASAAEVLAAALADRGRAVVVGSSTYGKGLVQTIAPLPDGGELFVTWSRILAPRGWPIQGLGVMPQVCTSLGGGATQQQLNALADGNQTMAPVILVHRGARAPLTPARIQSIRDACPAAAGREDDLSVARDLIANPAAYAAALLPPMR
jgi:carboxyl-terminal processing protease